MAAGIEATVGSVLRAHRAIARVRLAGSRVRGTATALSDWDFAIETTDFPALSRDLPALVLPLHPLAVQWDRLAERATFMLMLAGPTKVDLLFDEPWQPAPPWLVSKETLPGLNDHFWDWILWIASKQLSEKDDLARAELAKMAVHLLRPLAVVHAPESVEEAVAEYQAGLAACERRLHLRVDRRLGDEVLGALRRNGFPV